MNRAPTRLHGQVATTRLTQFPEGIEDLESRTSKVTVVPGRDGQAVSPRRRRDVAVLDRHALPRLVEQPLLFRPHVSHGHVEPVNAPVQGVHEPRQPGLGRLTLPTFFRAHRVRQLRNDDRARVAVLLLGLEPRDDVRVTRGAWPAGR